MKEAQDTTGPPVLPRLWPHALTDRALHDGLEGRVLAEHPEWVQESEACEPCVAHYRRLLKERVTREERLRESLERAAVAAERLKLIISRLREWSLKQGVKH